MDGVYADLQEILRLPSDAGTQFFHWQLPVSIMRQVYRHRDRTPAWNRDGILPLPILCQSCWHDPAYG